MSCIHCINPEMSGGNPEPPLSYSSSPTIFVAAPRPLKAESHTSNFSNLGSVVRRRPQSPSAHSSIPHLSAVHHVVFVPCPVNSSPQHHHLRIPIFPNELVDFCKPFQKIMPFHEPPWPEIQTHQLLSGRRSWPTSPSSTESPTSPCAEQIAVLLEFGK